MRSGSAFKKMVVPRINKLLYLSAFVLVVLMASAAPSQVALGVPQVEVAAPDLIRWMTPFWKGTVMNDESLCMWGGPGAGEVSAPLLFGAKEIISVQDSAERITYRQDIDWKLENNWLVLPPGSTIPWMPASKMFLSQASVDGKSQPMAGGDFILFSEGPFFHQHQIAVTYKHSADAWKGPIPTFNPDALPKTLAKLRNKQPLKILGYGDSIMEGANASAFTRVPPYMPTWAGLVQLWMEHIYQAQVTLVNKGVGGTGIKWGAQHATEAFSNQHADLVIIHFGMNDRMDVPAAVFKENLKKIMQTAMNENPNGEFILVASMVNSPKWTPYGNLAAYRDVLKSMSGPGVGFVDMMAMHLALLEHKRYEDMTGNNVNHPNDFLIRVYAQSVSALLADPDAFSK